MYTFLLFFLVFKSRGCFSGRQAVAKRLVLHSALRYPGEMLGKGMVQIVLSDSLKWTKTFWLYEIAIF